MRGLTRSLGRSHEARRGLWRASLNRLNRFREALHRPRLASWDLPKDLVSPRIARVVVELDHGKGGAVALIARACISSNDLDHVCAVSYEAVVSHPLDARTNPLHLNVSRAPTAVCAQVLRCRAVPNANVVLQRHGLNATPCG